MNEEIFTPILDILDIAVPVDRPGVDGIVVVDGIEDYIIVDKEDVLLIYPKAKEQDIKKVLATVKDTFGEQYG